MQSFKDLLKEILIRENIVKPEDLERALAEQQKSGGELSKILVRMGLVGQEDLTLILSKGLGMPPIDITRLKIDPVIVKMISKEIAVTYQVILISRIGQSLTLAMADPLNIFAIDNVKALTGLEINPIIARPNDIAQAIDTYYGADTQNKFEQIIKSMDQAEELELIRDGMGAIDPDEIINLSKEAPIIRLTDVIVKQGILAKASDIFIEPMEKTLRIRYRIDGIIREVDRMSKVFHFPIVSRIKIISTLDISEHRLPQDGRFKIVLEDKREVDLRVSILPAALGENVVLRILDKNAAMLDVSKLGFNPSALETLKQCSQKPHGMILSCGPTGSGKTTTLYSILKFVDSPEKNIITVEEPVEYQMKGITQVNVRPEVGLTFGSSLRSILRQDPDIIMIGEIRDFETLDIAVKAALTGHLVLSSLHTTTAAGSIIRIMNMGVEPFLICSSVIVIIAQRLLRRLCTKCKTAYQVPEAVAQKVGLIKLGLNRETPLFKPKGCKHCQESGYSGRVGITEVLMLTPKIKDLIMQRAGEYKIKEQGIKDGMISMREDGLRKAVAGLTSLEEVLRVTASD